jgi:hypothetical protein
MHGRSCNSTIYQHNTIANNAHTNKQIKIRRVYKHTSAILVHFSLHVLNCMLPEFRLNLPEVVCAIGMLVPAWVILSLHNSTGSGQLAVYKHHMPFAWFVATVIASGQQSLQNHVLLAFGVVRGIV